MNRHRILNAVALLCVAICMIVSGSSCADDRPDGRTLLLGQVGPGFDILVITDPTALARSAGEEALAKLHSGDSRLYTLIASAEGVDKEAAVAVSYSNPVQNAIMLPVIDRRKLASSLEKAGWKKALVDGADVFSDSGDYHRIFIDDKVMWMVRADSDTEASEAVSALKARAGALPAWLSKRLGDVTDRPAAFCYNAPDSTAYFGTLALDGPTASVSVKRIDRADGLRLTFVGNDRLQKPGDVLDAVDADAMVSFALALPRDFDLRRHIDNFTGGAYLSPEITALIEKLDGRIGLSVNLAGNDFTDFDAYRAALGLGTREGESSAALTALSLIARSNGVPVRGLAVNFGGKDLLVGTAPSLGLLMLATPGYKPEHHPKSAEDCIMWLRIRLLQNMAPVAMLGIDGGVDVKAELRPEAAQIDISFPGSKSGVMANLINILAAID